MNFFTFLFVPMIIFLTVVAPVWIFMHYRHVNRSSQSLNEEDRENIDSMLAMIDKLRDRIQALESLLDADQPNWRSSVQTHTKVSGE